MKRTFGYALWLVLACAAARSAESAGEALTIEGADGWKLHGTLYLPADVPRENDQARPTALVICHPMLSKTQVTYAPLVPKLLERGFAVLGILIMNIHSFGLPMAAYFTDPDRRRCSRRCRGSFC